MKGKVLIVDDDPQVRSILSAILKFNRYQVSSASDTDHARRKIASENPDLILLDAEVSPEGAVEFSRDIKENQGVRIPILFLAMKDREIERVSQHAEADDFITPPFHPNELMARIHIALRRQSLFRPSPGVMRSDSLFVDFSRRLVEVGRREVRLTPKEFDLLELLCKNRHKTFTDKTIFGKIWGAHSSSQIPTVYTHVDRLRKKLMNHGLKIKTIPGQGYRFDERKN